MKQDIGVVVCSSGGQAVRQPFNGNVVGPYRGKLLTARQAAAFLQVSERTCRSWCELGMLPACKIGPKLWRIWEADLQTYLENCRAGGPR